MPNDGEGYKFTKEELMELLDKIYDKGRADERMMWENVTIKST